MILARARNYSFVLSSLYELKSGLCDLLDFNLHPESAMVIELNYCYLVVIQILENDIQQQLPYIYLISSFFFLQIYYPRISEQVPSASRAY